jgi:hypothetical protein
VLQTGTTTTYIYPFKWYMVPSSTGTGAKYSTTIEYVDNGDALLSTTDQRFASGAATGSSQTRYSHPDHLGSTNAVTRCERQYAIDDLTVAPMILIENLLSVVQRGDQLWILRFAVCSRFAIWITSARTALGDRLGGEEFITLS